MVFQLRVAEKRDCVFNAEVQKRQRKRALLDLGDLSNYYSIALANLSLILFFNAEELQRSRRKQWNMKTLNLCDSALKTHSQEQQHVQN